MEVVAALAQLGGVARTDALLGHTTRKRLRTAVDKGQVQRLGRGLYGLPTADRALAAATALCGVVSHLSAAASWGWEMKAPPERPQVTVSPRRNVGADRRRGTELRWREVPPEHRSGRVTRRARTVVDCARDLPFDEALAVADAALREGRVDRAELLAMVEALPARNRSRARRVVEAADERSFNPFESVLRAYALDAGLDVVPQQRLRSHGLRCMPDLVDETRRLVVEAESFEYHGRQGPAGGRSGRSSSA
jgi:hypothetical protein